MKKYFEISHFCEKIKPLGRYQILSTGIACDHSASGIEFRASVVGAVELTVYTTVEKDGCDCAYFTVYIDGVRQAVRYEAHEGEDILRIADFDTPCEHTIRIVKQTESNYNLCELRALSFDGELLTVPVRKKKYIEYIGDSLSCGMGILGKKESPEPQTSRWEDVTLAYTYCSAEELDADYSIVSESGIGLSGSWFDPLFDFYYAWSYKRDKEQRYDFAIIPDLIVINLGTNDFYLNCDLGICSLEEVFEKTKEFIAFVRSFYGKDIPVVWVGRFVPLGESYINAIDAAIKELGGEHARIYRLDVPQSKAGALGHPDIVGHAVAKDRLVGFIKENNLL